MTAAQVVANDFHSDHPDPFGTLGVPDERERNGKGVGPSFGPSPIPYRDWSEWSECIWCEQNSGNITDHAPSECGLDVPDESGPDYGSDGTGIRTPFPSRRGHRRSPQTSIRGSPRPDPRGKPHWRRNSNVNADRIAIPLPDGRWLVMDAATFAAALKAGEAFGPRGPIYAPSVAHTESRMLTADEMAERTGVDASWFLTQARRNQIPHTRFGKYVRFDPDAVVAAMAVVPGTRG